MKKLILVVALLFIGAVCFSQSVPLQTFGTYFKAPNAKIEWEARSNVIPSQIPIYETEENKFTAKQIEALVKFCGLSLTNKAYDKTNVIGFELPDKSKRLGIYYPWGFIDFTTKEVHHDQTNLVKNVPSAEDARKRTLNILGEIGIKPSDIEKNQTNSKPRLMALPREAIYFLQHEPITNLYQREIEFKRSVDGMTVNGVDAGGNGSIVFGDHGMITTIRVFWPKLKSVGTLTSPSPGQIINWIKEGKAVYGFRLMSDNPIDWPSVREIKIHKEEIFLWAGMLDQRLKRLQPGIDLWARITMNEGSQLDITITCPFQE